MKPSLSILLPVYNAARYLPAALASLRAQTFTDYELIAVDDGSADRSLAILARAADADPRIRVISRPNTGIVGALNDGLEAARAPVVARMDADDIAIPDRLARQFAFLRLTPEFVCLGTAVHFMDARSALLKPCPRSADHDAIERALLLGDGGQLIHPSIMFRRDAVLQIGGYRLAAQWIEDLDLYLRLARVGRLTNLPAALLHYRIHEQSVNFTRNTGRHERKLRILAEAHAARGLPFDPAAIPPPAYKSAFSPDDLCDYAITSLGYGRRGRPWHYTWRALRAAPRARRPWRTLSYLLKHRLGLIRT
ncbi:glycosyltransferase [Termitidicoccus mucosus]|uniref:Glycosyltransferase 2-like domain-containing protein n=1 Tax=Termitidicoccus mucosus TaxID=1184151 RepID=A0A178IEW4_9BACT|nr:hypothetical protein AW736_22155 [Opitutaceae bacterium TSB47]